MRNIITRWLTAICLSSLLSYIWPSLPPLWVVFLLTCGLTVATAVLFLRPPNLSCIKSLKTFVIIAHGLAVGTLWMASVGHWYYSSQLPRVKIQQDVIISGTVVDANCINDWHTYTLKTDFIAGAWTWLRKVRVHEQSAHPCMQPGDSITATVRLKPAYGVANPIGFNYQQYLASKGIVATGTLRKRHQRTIPPSTFRKHIHDIINAHPYGHQRWLSVLLLGQKDALTESDWSLLRRTGTGHLFSISGLHLGLVAGALFPVAGLLATMVCLRQRRTGGVIATTFCLIAVSTFLYSVLTGAELPVVRAWLLLVSGLLISLGNRHWRGVQVGTVMITGCVLLFPLSILSASFYLSAGAVAIIWWLCWRWQWHRLRWYAGLWRLQVALSVALLPLTVGWFSVLSFSAIPINLLLVPLMSLVLPILLLLLIVAYCMPMLAPSAMWLANHLVGYMVGIVESFDHYLPAPLVLYPETPVVITVFVAIIVAGMPSFRFQRRCVGILLLPLFFSSLPLTPEMWELHVLDAGQGTATLITRGRHALIVDTGASNSKGAPTTERGMIPLIARYNLVVDYVFTSHDDNDHAGGSQALQQYLKKRGQSPQWLYPENGCSAGRSLLWQGLQLSMLWPDVDSRYAGNNGSCVIAIEGLSHRLLLPGDIERAAEYALLATKQPVNAEILLAPHHGSSTSSTGAFIKNVSPKLVIFTQGFENRWGFPSASVVTRYRQHGVKMLATSETGYIRLSMREGQPIQVKTLRNDLRPRWYLRPIKFSTMD